MHLVDVHATVVTVTGDAVAVVIVDVEEVKDVVGPAVLIVVVVVVEVVVGVIVAVVVPVFRHQSVITPCYLSTHSICYTLNSVKQRFKLLTPTIHLPSKRASKRCRVLVGVRHLAIASVVAVDIRR